MKSVTLACTIALALLSESAHSRQASTPETGIAGVRMVIALTNNVLIAGSNTLLKCWITNDSTNGLVLERNPGEDRPEKYQLEVWLRAEGGKDYVLSRGPGHGARVSRMAEGFAPREVRSYSLRLGIAGDIPSGHYQLRAKRQLRGPGFEVLSNILDVQVK
jgi:hypothetical protein